jgi:deoxyadenosine/deoxycytidine kinase
MQRIARRGRKSEEKVPRSYVDRLNVLYEEWFARYDRSPTLVLPSDRMDYVTDLFDRHDLLQTIEKHLG